MTLNYSGLKRSTAVTISPCVASNPVHGIPKLREAGRRLTYLPLDGVEEPTLQEVLAPELKPLFTVSVHTGLRWSEQIGLRWRDVDVLMSVITVGRSKNGSSRRVQMNQVVRSVLFDLATQRARPDDPDEMIFRGAYRTVARLFSQAVSRAQAALRAAGKDASNLDGYTWHSNRHTFASRLVMAGVDLRTVQELGGWKTLSMVQRYSHLAPGHLQSAVDRLVPQGSSELARN